MLYSLMVRESPIARVIIRIDSLVLNPVTHKSLNRPPVSEITYL